MLNNDYNLNTKMHITWGDLSDLASTKNTITLKSHDTWKNYTTDIYGIMKRLYYTYAVNPEKDYQKVLNDLDADILDKVLYYAWCIQYIDRGELLFTKGCILEKELLDLVEYVYNVKTTWKRSIKIRLEKEARKIEK